MGYWNEVFLGEVRIFGGNEAIRNYGVGRGCWSVNWSFLNIRSLIKLIGMLSWVIGDFWENILVVLKVGMLYGNIIGILWLFEIGICP